MTTAKPKDKPISAQDIPDRDQVLLTEFEGILTKLTHDALNTLETRQQVCIDTILQFQMQMKAQESLMTERIILHERRILEAEAHLLEREKALASQEEALKMQKEELQRQLETQQKQFTKLIRDMDAVLEEQQMEQTVEAESNMEEWEERITKIKEDQIAELTTCLEEFIKQAKKRLTEALKQHTRHHELRTKAWIDVATQKVMETLKANFNEYKRVQQISIENFCSVNLQNLQIDRFGDCLTMTRHSGPTSAEEIGFFISGSSVPQF